MSPAPWDPVPSKDQHFVLITGANSGVGLGIGQRLIDDFLHTRPLSSHLILLPTTRSPSKSRETVLALRRHLEKTARESRALRARGRLAPDGTHANDYIWTDTFRRVHILSPQLDLCDLRGIYAFARRLEGGVVSNPPDEDGMADILTDVRIPRLDAVILNAGFGGWDGLDIWGATKMVFTKGIVEAFTYPDFKMATPGGTIRQKPAQPSKASDGDAEAEAEELPELGAVFCSNVFGHYLLGHALLALLSRKAEDTVPPGRIIWTSSVEPEAKHFTLDDLQGVTTTGPYESSKRLTDVLALTCGLPGVSAYSESYFRLPPAAATTTSSTTSTDSPQKAGGEAEGEILPEGRRPKVYLSHPGVMASTLFPLPAMIFWLYYYALVFARWLGSPWHTADGYTASASPAWLALESQDALDASGAERVKWGSACDRLGRPAVKKTEVEGWGWEGLVEGGGNDDKAKIQAVKEDERGILRRSVGRRAAAADVTAEEREEFEVLGARCWKAMEELRKEWEERLGVGPAGK